jgi:hypothetical protein
VSGTKPVFSGDAGQMGDAAGRMAVWRDRAGPGAFSRAHRTSTQATCSPVATIRG